MFAKIILLAGAGATAVWLLPAPAAEFGAWAERQVGFTTASCSLAPSSCFSAKARSYRAAIERLEQARAQAETGLGTVDAEQAHLSALAETNQGLQQRLRQKVQAMLQTGASSLEFQGRRYSRAEVEQQASLLTREAEVYRARLAGFGGERQRLTDARGTAVVDAEKLASLLATLDAEQALAMASGSLARARELFASADAIAGQADRLAQTAVVRSTPELQPGTATPMSSFDFDSWMKGGTGNAPG